MALYDNLADWKARAAQAIKAHALEMVRLLAQDEPLDEPAQRICALACVLDYIDEPSLTAQEREELLAHLIEVGNLADVPVPSLTYLVVANQTPTPLPNHNALPGLQGGRTTSDGVGEYRHVTQADVDRWNSLTPGGASLVLFAEETTVTETRLPFTFPAGQDVATALRNWLTQPPAPLAALAGSVVREKGTATPVALSYTATRPVRGRAITLIQISGGPDGTTSITPTGNTQSGSANRTTDGLTNQVYSLLVSDGTLQAQAQASVEYRFRAFWGYGPADIDAAGVLALAGSALLAPGGAARSYAMQGTGFPWIVLHAEHGSPQASVQGFVDVGAGNMGFDMATAGEQASLNQTVNGWAYKNINVNVNGVAVVLRAFRGRNLQLQPFTVGVNL